MENTQKHYTGGEIKKARQSSSMGLIIRQKEPPNLETPFDQFDSFLTPTELFYIRSHFPAPKLDLASYQLRIDGAVRSPFSLSYSPKKPGQYTLLARATDAKGDAQPDKHDRNYGTYVINHPLPIEVFVAPGNGN
jgi:hypothetical protein